MLLVLGLLPLCASKMVILESGIVLKGAVIQDEALLLTLGVSLPPAELSESQYWDSQVQETAVIL